MTVKEFEIQLALGLIPKDSILKRCWRCKTKTPHRMFPRVTHDIIGSKRMLREAIDRCIKCGSTTHSNKI